MTEHATTIVQLREPEQPPELAVIPKLNVPSLVGIPVNAPVAGLSVIPPGKVPLVTPKEFEARFSAAAFTTALRDIYAELGFTASPDENGEFDHKIRGFKQEDDLRGLSTD